MSVFGLPGCYISRGGMDMNDQGEKTGVHIRMATVFIGKNKILNCLDIVRSPGKTVII
jgi:hypothetical protein